MQWLKTFWHKNLGQPYILHCENDQGSGQPVILLHGIASSSRVWRHAVKNLAGEKCRVLTFDLLGFGESPKPTDTWIKYSVDDHAQSVIATLKRYDLRKPVVLVAHSMGCLVAIHIASVRPDLVKHLLLYEPPLFADVPLNKAYEKERRFYTRIYRNLIRRRPFGLRSFNFLQKAVGRLIGFELHDDTWVPFARSMENTILDQNAVEELHKIAVPTNLIYGRFDGLVINDKHGYFLDKKCKNITTSEVPETHLLSPRVSKIISRNILEILG